MTRLRYIFKCFVVYAGLVGFVTFPLFIIEEAIQMATFGTWAAKEAKSAEMQLSGITVIEKLNRTLKFINTLFGWIQPLSLISYDHFARATDSYVDSVKSKLIAQNPEIFEGQEIEFNFQIKQYHHLENGTWEATDGKISIILDSEPKLKGTRVRGKVIDGKVHIQ